MKTTVDPTLRAELEARHPGLGAVPDSSDRVAFQAYKDNLAAAGDQESLARLQQPVYDTDDNVRDHIESSAASAQRRQNVAEKLLSQYTKKDRTGKPNVNKNAALLIGAVIAIPVIAALTLGTGSGGPEPVVQEQPQEAVTPPISTNETEDIEAFNPDGDIPAPPASTGDIPAAPAGTGASTTGPNIQLDDGAGGGSSNDDPATYPQPNLESGGSPSSNPVPQIRIPEPVTQRDPEEAAPSPITYAPIATESPAGSPSSSGSEGLGAYPVSLTPPSVQPDVTAGAGLDFGLPPVNTGGGTPIPIPDVTGQPAVPVPVTAQAPAEPGAPAAVPSATVYTRTPAAGAAAAPSASRSPVAYRVTPPPARVPQVYVAPAAVRLPTVVGAPRVQSVGQPPTRAASVQSQTPRPGAASAPATVAATAQAGQAAAQAVTGVVGTPSAQTPAAQPSSSAATSPQATSAAPAAKAGMVVYRRPVTAATAASQGADTPAAASVVYTRTSAAAQQVQAASATPAQNTTPGTPSASATPASGYTDGTTIPAVLTGDVITALGGSMPVLARAQDGRVWIGAATIDGVRRMQILFDRYVDPVSGQIIPARALAFSPAGKAGLDAKITTKAPNFALDVLRAAVSGFDRYVTTLSQQKTVTTLPGGQTVQSSTAPNLGETILANTSGIFKLPETGSTFIPVGEMAAGSRLFIVVNVTRTTEGGLDLQGSGQ